MEGIESTSNDEKRNLVTSGVTKGQRHKEKANPTGS